MGHAKHGPHGPGWKVPTNLIYSSILVEKEGHWCAGNGVFGIEVISYSHKTTYPTSSKLKKKTYPSLFKSLHVAQKGQKGQTCSTNVCSHPNFEPVYSEKKHIKNRYAPAGVHPNLLLFPTSSAPPNGMGLSFQLTFTPEQTQLIIGVSSSPEMEIKYL